MLACATASCFSHDTAHIFLKTKTFKAKFKNENRMTSGASFINKVPRTILKSALGHFLGRT